MRIEADFTRDDWHAYVRFYTQRARGHNRQAWLFLILMAAAVSVCLWVLDRLFDRMIDPVSTLIGIVLVYGIIFVFSRTNQAAKAIPESWLGRHVYELLPDALHAQGSSGTARYPWSSIREVCEDPAYLYLLLDNVLTIVLPKRCMEPHGGAAAVKAEIERLRAASAVEVEGPARSVVESGNASGEPASGTEVAKPKESPAGWVFIRNLVAGLRLAVFLPVRADDLRPSARQVALFILLTLAAWLGVERLLAEGEVYIGWYAVTEMGWLVAIAVLSVLLLTPGRYSAETTARLLTALASAAPFVLVVAILALAVPLEYPFRLALELALVLYVLLVMVRAQRVSINETRSLAIAKGIVSIVAVCFVFDTTVWERPEPWYSDNETDESLEHWQASERALFAQPDLIDAAVERAAVGTAGKTEVYFVGFAGYGEQGVFEKEIRFANGAFGKRIDLEGRSLRLVNSPDRNGETMTLATASGLTRSLAGIARRMNVEEDVLLLFLTSHGSEDAELSVSQGYLPLDELDGETLRRALDDSGIRWRVIVISACHAGSFIPKLSNERTLIIAAAHADKSSFGCSDERELTYFGEAFLRDALPASRDLLDAFARAKELVTAREIEEGQEPSDPQLFVGAQMKAKLAEVPLRVDAVAASAADAGTPPAAVRP